MEKRLEKRHDQLVHSHMNNNSNLASGIKTLLKGDAAFNQTQAAWRFFNNENVSLTDLTKPILDAGHELCREDKGDYVLVAHRSYTKDKGRKISHLDELAQQIQWIESQNFSKKLVHIIDREADSIGFFT